MNKKDFLSKNSNMRILEAREQKMIIGGSYPKTACDNYITQERCGGSCVDSEGVDGTCMWARDIIQGRSRCRCATVNVDL